MACLEPLTYQDGAVRTSPIQAALVANAAAANGAAGGVMAPGGGGGGGGVSGNGGAPPITPPGGAPLPPTKENIAAAQTAAANGDGDATNWLAWALGGATVGALANRLRSSRTLNSSATTTHPAQQQTQAVRRDLARGNQPGRNLSRVEPEVRHLDWQTVPNNDVAGYLTDQRPRLNAPPAAVAALAAKRSALEAATATRALRRVIR